MDGTFILALASAIGTAALIVLHVVAPHTKNTVDDKIVALLEKVVGK